MPIPPTNYILTALREVYIKYADASEMGRDLFDGLKEKEKDLSNITHEKLFEIIPNYLEQEALIASTIKDNLVKLLVGTIGPDDMILTPPVITFTGFTPYYPSSSSSSSSSSSLSPDIHVGEYYLLVSEISGGNMDMNDFTYEWSVTSGPIMGYVHFNELYSDVTPTQWNIGTIIDFTEPGFYVLQLAITHKVYTSLVIVGRVSAQVFL